MQQPHRLPNAEFSGVAWLAVLGTAFRGFSALVRSRSQFSRPEYARMFFIMGWYSVPMVTFCALFISFALTTQVMNQLRAFAADDLAGSLICVGLLREMGPLTVGMAWGTGMVAHLVTTLQANPDEGDSVLASWMAAGLTASIPISMYGLTVGFLAAALYAPYIGNTSTGNFIESARQTIQDKDVLVYFIKLVPVNPTIVVLTSYAYARIGRHRPAINVFNAVAGYAVTFCIANYLTSVLAFLF